MNAMSKLHLIIGPVGAGKTTYARAQITLQTAAFFDLDAWMVRLYGDDPRPSENVIPWYLERRERVRDLIWDTSLDVLAGGTNVLLELGLVSRAERELFYTRAQDEGLDLTVICLDAPRDVRRERVARRNESGEKYIQIVPLPFFEHASDAWEAPTEAERRLVSMVDA